jgi:hypothetical protein
MSKKRTSPPGGESSMAPPKKAGREKMVDQITPEQAASVLRKLWHVCPDVRERIEAEIEAALKAIDYDEVACDVESSLEFLDEEELFDRSGPRRTGYHDPGEMAGMMIEEALEPFQDQLKRYYEMGMVREATEYCRGILKGLYAYKMTLSGTFSEYALETPQELFACLRDGWKKRNEGKADRAKMDRFIENECTEWSHHKRKR